jgi:hypothetical protein
MAKSKTVKQTESPYDIIRRDEKLLSFKKKLSKGLFALDTKKLIFDISNMHRIRLTRTIKTKEIIQKYQVKFIEASLQGTSFRSRITEIKLSCMDTLSELDNYLSVLKKYLKSTYADTLKKLYTTQADRDSLIDMVLEKAILQKKQLEHVIKYCDVVVADIDATSWTLKGISEAMQLGAEKRSIM